MGTIGTTECWCRGQEESAIVHPGRLQIVGNESQVASTLQYRVHLAALASIQARGHFAFAITGGNLPNLFRDWEPPWAAKASLAYVNHKCVAVTDTKNSTHAKACKLFLDHWIGAGAMVIEPPGALNGEAAAAEYTARLTAIPELILPRADNGLPKFDMILLDLGDDGHIGALHPNRQEVFSDDAWVLAVDKDTPASITFSLPVILASREVLVIACGGSSDKMHPRPSDAGVAPQQNSKAESLARALEGPSETPKSLPACALRECAVWIADKSASSKLSVTYTAQ